MDFNATIDIIIRDLEEARKIIDDLKKYPGVPILQVELAKAKCKSAGEVIALLKDSGNMPLVEEESQKTEDRSQKSEDKIQKEENKSPVVVKPDQMMEVNDQKPHIEVEKKPVSEKTPQSSKKHTEQPIMADSFSHLSSRFNEQLGSNKGKDDLSGIMKTKHLTNLSDAIGINDRFLFIREIFDGNKDAYLQAITRLDNAGSVEDAKAVIMSYTGDNDENDAVKQLLELVKRKLPANE